MKNIASVNWTKNWSGRYSLLSCSLYGHIYTDDRGKTLGAKLHRMLSVVSHGTGAGYYDFAEFESFKEKIAQEIAKGGGIAEKTCREMVKKADELNAVVGEVEKLPPTGKSFDKFLEAFYSYAPLHKLVKNAPEKLPPEHSEKMLPLFEGARVHAERAYDRVENYIRSTAKKIGDAENLPANLAYCLTKDELAAYFKGSALPGMHELEERDKSAVLYFQDGKMELLSKNDAAQAEKSLHGKTPAGQVRGKTGYPGKATGKARIVHDPLKAAGFAPGEILIAGMTRPEFVPLMKRAAAIVTDAGGILSHAAIVARELRIPCVVGTEKATKAFKDGDLLEVDATNGTVRKIGRG